MSRLCEAHGMCPCQKIEPALQTFRITKPGKRFEVVARLPPDRAQFMEKREVWRCRECGQYFASLTMPYKDLEEFAIRAPGPEWEAWNWAALAEVADRSRWNGLDPKVLL